LMMTSARSFIGCNIERGIVSARFPSCEGTGSVRTERDGMQQRRKRHSESRNQHLLGMECRQGWSA
jgi:hypothetical protein